MTDEEYEAQITALREDLANAQATLRDTFAGQALAGMLADTYRHGSYEAFAAGAYYYADAMLEARKKNQ